MFATLLSIARPVARRLRRWTRRPRVGAVEFGTFGRLEPVSRDWGFDRGTPVDRYYIEHFLDEHRQDVQGRVLEVDTNAYTRRFGGDRVTRSDVVHISEKKRGVTIVADLTRGDAIPSDAFDCVILTQTLQLMYEPGAALRTINRILAPGGVALVTVPGISKMTKDEKGLWGYFWGFTTLSARRLFEEHFRPEEVEVEAVGNVLAAISFLHGVAAEELRREDLDRRDPEYEVLLTIRARKPADSR